MRFLYLLGMLGLCLTPAQARNTTMAELLGRQCVAEISLSPRMAVSKELRLRQKLEECQLMWNVQADKVGYDPADAEVWPARLADHLLKYNSLFKRKETHRQWVLELTADGAEPPSWPKQRAKWEHYDKTWLAIVDEAELFLAGERRHPCHEANQYGGRCDDSEHACDAVPICWKRQWCGRPQEWWSQAYWTRPNGRACPRVISASDAAGAP